MPFWCETRWRSSAYVFSATTGEMSNQDPYVLNGMSWTEKAGPERSAVMKGHSFLEQGSYGGRSLTAQGQSLATPGQSLTAPAVTPAAT